MTHSPFGPSALERRSLCPGSYREEFGKEDIGSDVSAMGDRCHAAVADMIRNKSSTPRDEALPREELELAVKCCEVARQVEADLQETSYEVMVEKGLDCTSVHPDVAKGTADCIYLVPFERAIVIDWKMGYKPPPGARRNIQLATYGLAVAEEYGVDEVTLMLYMPRLDLKNAYTASRAHLTAARDYIRQVVDAARNPWAPCIPSDPACEYCRGIVTCPAIVSLAAEARCDPDGLPPSELARLADAADVLDRWCGKIKQRINATLNAGGHVSGWGLKAGRSTYKWQDGVTEETLRKIGEKLEKPVDGLVKHELVTVGELKKLWGWTKGVRGNVEPLILTIPGKPSAAKLKEEEPNA